MKSKYHADFPLMAEGYARDGLNDIQIAQKLGVHVATYYEYQNKYPEFSEAIARGKAPVDVQVENALLKRCLGLKVQEEIVDVSADGKTRSKIITKEVPPDVGACTFWLSKRKPQKWGNIQEDTTLQNNVESVAVSMQCLEFEERQKLLESLVADE